MVAVVTEVLKLDMSINLYMFHGGTNFGFMNGAAAVGVTLPKPMVTSYGMCNQSVFDRHFCDIGTNKITCACEEKQK